MKFLHSVTLHSVTRSFNHTWVTWRSEWVSVMNYDCYLWSLKHAAQRQGRCQVREQNKVLIRMNQSWTSGTMYLAIKDSIWTDLWLQRLLIEWFLTVTYSTMNCKVLTQFLLPLSHLVALRPCNFKRTFHLSFCVFIINKLYVMYGSMINI